MRHCFFFFRHPVSTQYYHFRVCCKCVEFLAGHLQEMLILEIILAPVSGRSGFRVPAAHVPCPLPWSTTSFLFSCRNSVCKTWKFVELLSDSLVLATKKKSVCSFLQSQIILWLKRRSSVGSNSELDVEAKFVVKHSRCTVVRWGPCLSQTSPQFCRKKNDSHADRHCEQQSMGKATWKGIRCFGGKNQLLVSTF